MDGHHSGLLKLASALCYEMWLASGRDRRYSIEQRNSWCGARVCNSAGLSAGAILKHWQARLAADVDVVLSSVETRGLLKCVCTPPHPEPASTSAFRLDDRAPLRPVGNDMQGRPGCHTTHHAPHTSRHRPASIALAASVESVPLVPLHPPAVHLVLLDGTDHDRVLPDVESLTPFHAAQPQKGRLMGLS